MRITRRRVLTGLAGLGVGSLAAGGYAVADGYWLDVTAYDVVPAGWPSDLRLKLVVLADLHACDPWMSVPRIRTIVETANAMRPDAVLLLGDFVSAMGPSYAQVMPHHLWAREMARLEAPLGVHAVLGNHDWWDSAQVQDEMAGPPPVRTALEDAGIAVYENTAVRLEKTGAPFWIAGLGDQWAFHLLRHRQKHLRADGAVPRYVGVDDLPALMASITDDAPVVLMVHEPDIFPDVPSRVALTLAGHTHGGQIRVLGYAPVVPSRFGSRYAYGHIVEQDRHMIVSSGLGYTSVPVRIGASPEIVIVNLGKPVVAA